LLIRVAVPLPPFALWSAFPTSDYYGGSDAAQVSPPDLLGSVAGRPLTFRQADSSGGLGGGLRNNPSRSLRNPERG